MLTLQKSENHNRKRLSHNYVGNHVNFQSKPFLFLLFVSLQLSLANCCYTLKSPTSQCNICQTPSTFQCAYKTPESTQTNADYSSCLSYCCNSNTFVNASSCPFCINAAVANDGASSSQTSLIIIVVFVVLASICIFMSLKGCVRSCRQQQKQDALAVPSQIDLASYKIDELGPLYQDRNQNCSICLENECNIRTSCTHSYHSQCLDAWTAKQQKCPLCLSLQFNPLVLYCTVCFKQSMLLVLKNNKQAEEKQAWQKYQGYKCDACCQDTHDEVSLTFQQAQNNNKDLGKNIAPNVETQTRLLQ